ncbi:MAG: glycosyltransferase family 39 protein [Lewinellaceae bacterium]|nr:glycosyltransferase family 39 protein [Lewinellaceae bacterium]
MTRAFANLARNPWVWLGFGLLAVYLRGLFLDVMDVDAAQYASISMEMLQNGNWLQVQHRHADYLDKPPLLFWSSALSFALFGLHNWAYKLPSLLGAAAGVYATYRFCLLFYSKTTARHAAFILTACTGVLLLGNDVRTDTLLLGMTACAVWQLAVFFGTDRPSLACALGAGLFTGLAMLAKGPIGLIVPAFAVGTHLLLRRDWRRLADWRWLVGLVAVAVVLAPMCVGLYQQFDLHPEKTVNGRTGVSGLYFYFWEQSFGRITGENVWKNDTSPLYFLHVYLWAFLPWPILLAGALWRRFGALFQQKFRLPAGDEAFSIGAFVLTFVALSLSRYKLPHYIFVTLPWAAVLTARWLGQVLDSVAATSVAPEAAARFARYSTCIVLVVLAATSALLLGFVFPTANILKWGIGLGLFGAAAAVFWRNSAADALVQSGVLALLGAAFVLNFHFYPNLLPHQSTAAVPRYARQNGIPADKMAFFNRHGHALDFYAGYILKSMETPGQVRRAAADSGAFWLYTDAPGRAELDSAAVRYTPAATFQHFQVALLKPAFLNPAQRAESLQQVYLLKIEEQ